jgi:predicted dinucleotide-binding enzyme
MAAIIKNEKAVNDDDIILLTVPRNRKKFVKAQAKLKGMSVSAYLNVLIEKDMGVQPYESSASEVASIL